MGKVGKYSVRAIYEAYMKPSSLASTAHGSVV